MRIGWCAEMRNASLILLALVAGACGSVRSDAGAAPINGQAVSAPKTAPIAGKSDTALLFGRHTIKVRVDPASVRPDGPRDVRVLARHGRLVALSDSYASNPRGTSLCQAGNETWFRVIDSSARVERYARLVDSCRGAAQWGDPPVTVAHQGAEITLNLLSEAPITLILGDDGRVSASR